ncbi:hypothetical protein FDENT_13600 [Fusarium denticulatum]|uniref:2EXR domain-containing protein n=1 Tax=Fusarium denticulatum TaxID=48507 RepID=A0A8H5WK94_9HYPO|nr:hypothetical protein FDENT_13600 [Fusarium denticulatum]
MSCLRTPRHDDIHVTLAFDEVWDQHEEDSPHDLQAKPTVLNNHICTVANENQQLRRQHGTSFRLTNFPLELRMLVWERSLPSRRVLRITELPTTEYGHSSGRASCCCVYPPVLLYVCRESRKFALAHFKLFFEESFGRRALFKPTYIRPKLDVIYLDLDAYDEAAYGYPELDEVESIAVRWKDRAFHKIWHCGWEREPYFAAMTRLLLVTKRKRPYPACCCATVELLPDPDGQQEELEWTNFISWNKKSGYDIPNIQHIEVVVENFIQCSS